ncbi:uncharacterized protein ARMOST_20076 [Armillaria ostoyae]|uniref:F-box domain-containing protein n=1 Tax=Armillaria ostoyae TaxID=47428 RepID=A0A284S6C4_ARMOS|nr:uncharacterized protein ARMOST_20076 [Armillaria ostoyae]
MLALSNLPLLSHLSIDFHLQSPTQTSYSEFHDLEYISFGGTHMLDIIPTLVARSPNLTRLLLWGIRRTKTPVTVSSIFSGLGKGNCSRVEQLAIRGALTLPTHDVPLIVPHLHHLTSLRIRDINDVAPEFWSALRIEKIYIRDISVDIVNDALLEYLESYSGAKSMILVAEQSLYHGSFKFWSEILPKHADTLVELCVQPNFKCGGGWCLDTRSLDAIRRCKRLEILRVKIHQETLDTEDEPNIISRSLDSLHEWPCLNVLNFRSLTTPTIFPGEVHFLDIMENSVVSFRCKKPTEAALRLIVSTDCADYHLSRRKSDVEVYSFKDLHRRLGVRPPSNGE